jgi:hypothetical protein
MLGFRHILREFLLLYLWYKIIRCSSCCLCPCTGKLSFEYMRNQFWWEVTRLEGQTLFNAAVCERDRHLILFLVTGLGLKNEVTFIVEHATLVTAFVFLDLEIVTNISASSMRKYKCWTAARTSNEMEIHCLEQRFTNWWVASRFVVGREKFFKCDFFNDIKIKYLKKWETEETKPNVSNSFYWSFESTAPFFIFVHLWIWIFGNGRNENQISKQAAIVEFLAPENNSHWRGRQCRHQQ